KMEYCDGSSWTELGGGGGGGGITSCPSGWTMIGDPGKTTTFCIQSNEQPATNIMTAIVNCININDATHGRAHLCTHNEWVTACTVGGTGLTGMTNGWEMISGFNDGGNSDINYSWIVGNG